MTQSNDKLSKLKIPHVINSEMLEAMQYVAKMKESADRHGMGFVGGFVTPNGEKFVMTNMSEEDTSLLIPGDLK